MFQGPFVYRALRKALFIAATGAFMFQFGNSCDPTVRTTVLTGFQGLATSLVTAVFQNIALQSDTTNSSSSSSSNSSTST